MRHLFIIQCHEYQPALELGNLIKSLSSNFEVMFAYDEQSTDKKNLKNLPNSKGFSIGYFTMDQGYFHLNLWKYIASNSKYDSFDYYHLISQNDLPFKGLLKLDVILNGYDFYGFTWLKPSDIDLACLHKGITWYGVSNKVMNGIAELYPTLCTHMIQEVWVPYSNNSHIDSGFTGGFDEYLVGELIYQLGESFRGLSDCLRFVLYPNSDRLTIAGFAVAQVSDYGKLGRVASPVILEDTPATEFAFNVWNVLFGRKFEYNSDSYNKFKRLIKDEFKI